MDEQIITQTIRGLNIVVGKRRCTTDLTMSTNGEVTRLEFNLDKGYVISIADARLARHLFFSFGRSQRDTEIGRALVERRRRAR